MRRAQVPSEGRLIQKMAEGDGAAYDQFVATYGGRIRRLAGQYARTPSDADDLTLEIFVDIFRSIGSYKGRSSLATWVYRVAVNHCLRHRQREPMPPSPLDETQAAGDGASNPERQAQIGELGRTIDDAMGRLTPEHRDVVILHEMHGLTYAECAETLGVPVGTVKSRLSNAFRKLRTMLSGYVLGDDAAAIHAAPVES
jgi:RNA polymerase sigma-70 factor (ECF subfamily)